MIGMVSLQLMGLIKVFFNAVPHGKSSNYHSLSTTGIHEMEDSVSLGA